MSAKVSGHGCVRTDALQPGMRVILPTGAVRTVASVVLSGWVNDDDAPLLNVWYCEAPDSAYGPGAWLGRANSSHPAGLWQVER